MKEKAKNDYLKLLKEKKKPKENGKKKMYQEQTDKNYKDGDRN